ncbi:nadp-dependent malic enzyme like protein [Zymoseptoria brevis]|uniref:Malic enzyme n=1 Tax=Zymoseptoria brevis TaxID=1047168 RepID=A0A0F4GG54_9PEZI|nr:nadp-dependent malic enzyme like protein [Zymoseptoria brevis]
MRATTRCSHAFITSQLPRQSIPSHLRPSLHLHSNSPRLRYFTTTPTLTPTSSTSDPVSLTRPFASTSKSSATMTNIVQNLKGAVTSHPAATQSQNQDLPAPSDYDTSNSIEVRKRNHTYGLTPPAVESFENQTKRCMAILNSRQTPIEQYQYLSVLRNSNVHLFYRLLSENIKEVTPLIYTPTVGEACQRWSELYTQPEGMYLSFADRGNLHSVVQNWPHDVDITVVTDGSRILGLGDLGVNGMGIPVGKLSLYTACAGIHPQKTLPLCLDLGTSNETLRNDPLYLGSRRDKVTPEEEKEFLDEMMAALTERWPSIVIQFEDFKNPFPSLERYQDTYTMFNDDIQGTGAVITGGFINAVKQSGVAPADQRAVFLGAGSAGVGVAKQLTEFFIKEGLTEEQARKRFTLVDSEGMVTLDRPGRPLAEHKLYFARDDNHGKQFKTLSEVVEYVKPTILMGLSTIGGAFTPAILSRMAELNDRPVIFPLSNPSSKSECTFEEAITYTHGKCLFASGSPFPTLNYKGEELVPGQGNNMYVFPGIGLAAILSKSLTITQNMIYASAESLSTSLLPEEVKKNWLYPDIARIREVSVVVTRGVIRAAQRDGVDREVGLRGLGDEELENWIKSKMYDPEGVYKSVVVGGVQAREGAVRSEGDKRLSAML